MPRSSCTATPSLQISTHICKHVKNLYIYYYYYYTIYLNQSQPLKPEASVHESPANRKILENVLRFISWTMVLQETLLFMMVIFLLWCGFCCYAQIAQYLLSALRPPGPPGFIFGFSRRNNNFNGYSVASYHLSDVIE